mmetsp:Transcript_36919/g.147362  ORF Transcript_36919/g.147362 Transcript_36919/m.147362 type:complete len:93 (+) Transcript_36919:96-374(+)
MRAHERKGPAEPNEFVHFGTCFRAVALLEYGPNNLSQRKNVDRVLGQNVVTSERNMDIVHRRIRPQHRAPGCAGDPSFSAGWIRTSFGQPND